MVPGTMSSLAVASTVSRSATGSKGLRLVATPFANGQDGTASRPDQLDANDVRHERLSDRDRFQGRQRFHGVLPSAALSGLAALPLDAGLSGCIRD
jgi:hypothetical protein